MLNAILFLLIGLFLGSLLNVVVIRLPREKRLFGWPHCTRTGERLQGWQMLPVVGWLLQRGRARNGQPLHWIYLVVELLTGLVVMLLSIQYGLSAMFFYLTFVCIVLIITGAIDWLYRSIYTFVILGSALLVLIASALLPQMNLLNAGLGAFTGGFVFMLLFFLARIIFPSHAVPFGLGDVYLAIFIGAAVGLTNLSITLLYGIMMAGIVAAGMVVAKRLLHKPGVPDYMPYGTYLCLGAICYVVIQGL